MNKVIALLVAAVAARDECGGEKGECDDAQHCCAYITEMDLSAFVGQMVDDPDNEGQKIKADEDLVARMKANEQAQVDKEKKQGEGGCMPASTEG